MKPTEILLGENDDPRVHAFAMARMEHQGYTADDVRLGEAQTCRASGCEFASDIGFYQHEDEHGNSLHPMADALNEAAEIAYFAIEWFDKHPNTSQES